MIFFFEEKLAAIQLAPVGRCGAGRVGNCARCWQAFSRGSVVSWIPVASRVACGVVMHVAW